MGARHGAFGSVLPQLFFAEARYHDRQFVRRQRIRIMEHGRHRQIFAADRPVDDHLQSLDRGEHVNGAPISAGSVVIENQHQIIASVSRAFALASCRRL